MRILNNLRVRLVLWTVALEAILLLVFAVVVVLAVQNTQDQQIEATLRLSADQLNGVVDLRGSEYIIDPEDTAELQDRGVFVWILLPDNTVAMTLGDARTMDFPTEIPSLNEMINYTLPNNRSVRLLRANLQEGDQNLGAMVLGMPLHESKEFIRQIIISVGIAVPMVLVMSAAGGLFLAGRALSPVAVITNTARQISGADLSQRIDLKLPDDEIGRLALTFNAMLGRIDDAFQRERQLTSDVSHELRTPLAMLKTQLSLARSRPRSAEALIQMMADMEGDVDRMTKLVEQMLTLTRVEQSELVASKVVDLRQVLCSIVERFQMKSKTDGVNVNLELPPQLDLCLHGNEEQLRQVFVNLLENALKYSPSGSRVSINAARQSGKLSITVSDEGIGIPTEHLPHLFERFYRVDSARTRETGGFGLGLAITQAIIQAHDGEIQVTSQVGNGTSFIVTLPLGVNLSL